MRLHKSHVFRRFAVVLLVLITASGPRVRGADTNEIVLRNSRVAIKLDRESGGVRSIEDKETGEVHRLQGIGFAVTADRGVATSKQAAGVEASELAATWRFETELLRINLRYRLGAEDRFVEKWLEITAKDSQPYLLKELVLEEAKLEGGLSEVHLHDDQTIWHCPINLFLRGESGGCFAGLEYPWWQLEVRGQGGFRLGHVPNYAVGANEAHISEKYFLGVYRKEGIQRLSHGPYPGKRLAPYLSWNGSGLSQHFKGGTIPAQAIEPETLDWGEVWAMQEFMRKVLPEQPLPEEGFWVWQNGWWAGLFDPKPEILDRLKSAGVHDIMTAHTWYGRGNHPMPEPYLSQMRTAPLGFPVDKGVAGMPGPAGPAAGLHVQSDVLLDQFKPGDFTTDFRAPPAMEAFIAHGRKIGVHVSSFSLPGIWFDDKPNWGSIDQDGKPSEYLFGRKVSCPACDDYMNHLLAVHEAVFTKYQPRWWGWDGRWMSFWEVGAYRPGVRGVGPDPCYRSDHGHLPGDNFYKEWRNIMHFVAELRRRYPRMCLEQYLGLKRGGPWALRDLNADDNYFETTGADMNRFQTWHNQNDRFRPPYKNYAAVFGETPSEFQLSLLSTISVASYCQIGPGFKALALQENQDFLKKWRAWATENYAYLKVKRDLFDCPGYSRVDGSAHILRDRGFFFLFPGGFASEPGIANKVKADPRTMRAAIPLNRWVGLEDKQASFKLTELYPREGRDLGIYRYGEEFLYDLPRNLAAVLKIEPAGPGAKSEPPVAGKADESTIVVPAFRNEFDTPAQQKPVFGLSDNGMLVGLGTAPAGAPRATESSRSKGALCIEFDGISPSGAELGVLGLSAPVTVAFWMKPTDAQSDRRILSQQEGEAVQAGAIRLLEGRLEVWDGNTWGSLIWTGIRTNQWEHVTLVFARDGKVTGYLNAKPMDWFQAGFEYARTRAAIGAPFLGAHGLPYAGSLDDFRIIRRALSAAEIAQLYPAGTFTKSPNSSAAPAPKLTPFGREAREASIVPIRLGKSKSAPFWNRSSKQFIHAPAFDFGAVTGAATYRFTIHGSDGKDHVFEAAEPWAALTPVWVQIPVGPAQVKVEGLNQSGGAVVGVAGERSFHRGAIYNGPYRKARPAAEYEASARQALQALFNRDYFREWMKEGVPAEAYRKGYHAGTATPGGDQRPGDYAYPAKLIGQIIAGAALYAGLESKPADASTVVRIGEKAGDLLLKLQLAAGTPMEFFPPTYQEGLTGAAFMDRSRVTMNYPAEAAEAYLDFYDQTRDRKYLEAAVKIANTYQKLQLSHGTWYQMMDNRTGEALYPTLLVPVSVIHFLDRLIGSYGQPQFRPVCDRALKWVMENPVKTFNWQSQFEDAPPSPPYGSLSPQQACDLAQYLFDHATTNAAHVNLAIELLNFAEDQFVAWESPPRSNWEGELSRLSSRYWVTPSVQEQHQYWVPVNFSFATLIRTYLKAYRSTGRTIHIAKAIDLANTMLAIQELHHGEYPTYPMLPTEDGKWEATQNVWINCGVGTARAVLELADVLRDRRHALIKNHAMWQDLGGNPIWAHDGGLSRFGDRFYWYGTSYEGNPTGQYGMAKPQLWNGVQLYSSDNLVTWASEGVVLPRPEKGWGNLGTSGRPHVLYNQKTRKYVMWYWFHLKDPAVFMMVATADQPTGPFQPLGPREVGTEDGFASDSNVFQDDDGKAHLVYTDHGRTGRYAIRIDSLSDDYLYSNKEGYLVLAQGHEAPAMAKYKGKYLVAASGVTGWGGTANDYAVASSPSGPWSAQKVLTSSNQWGGQITSLLHLKESDTVLAMFDQWWTTRDEHHIKPPAAGSTDLNESRYVWLPVAFDPATETAKVPFHKEWNPFFPGQ